METLQPKLRFPEFKGDWKSKFFKEIYSFRSTNSLSRDKLNYEKGLVKNIHYGDIHSKFNSLFDIEKELVPFVNEDINLDKIPEDNYLRIKDLIIADASEDYDDIGKCIEIINLNNEKILAGLHTFVARPDLYEMSVGFGNYLMKSDYSKIQIKTIAQGTKVLSISTTRLSEIKVHVPSLEEQTKIANFLTAVDEKLNLLKEKKALLEDYKKGIMQKIFNQELRFKDDNGNDFEDWEEKSLREVTSITIGEFVIKTRQNPNGKYPVYNGGKSCTGYYDEFNNDGNKIVISARGANAGFVNFEKGKFWAGNSCYSVDILDKYQFEIIYFYYYIKFNENTFTENQQAANIPSVSKKDVEKFNIKIPVLKEQTKIANFLSAIDEKIVLVSNQIEDTQEYKKGLLQQLFV